VGNTLAYYGMAKVTGEKSSLVLVCGIKLFAALINLERL
jgi:hypothetical protein